MNKIKTVKEQIDNHKYCETHFLEALACCPGRDEDAEFAFNTWFNRGHDDIKLEGLNTYSFLPSLVLEKCDPEGYKFELVKWADNSDEWLYDPTYDTFIRSDDVLEFLDGLDQDDIFEDLQRENMKGIL